MGKLKTHSPMYCIYIIERIDLFSEYISLMYVGKLLIQDYSRICWGPMIYGTDNMYAYGSCVPDVQRNLESFFYLWVRRNKPMRGAIYVTSSLIDFHWLRPCLAMIRKRRCHDLRYPRDTWRPAIGHAYCRHSHRPLGKNMTFINTAHVVTYFPQTCHLIHFTLSRPVDAFIAHRLTHHHWVEYSRLNTTARSEQKHFSLGIWCGLY